jgi:dienelactone hydrolase
MEGMDTCLKRLTTIGFVACAALGIGGCKSVNPGSDRWSKLGPETTTEETTGPGDHFTIFRPTTLNAHTPRPIVVFAVGTGGSPDSYRGLLQHWASHGFVIIAGDDGNQANGDQALEGLAWLVDQNTSAGSVFEGALNVARIATAGHSQGGNAAIHVALRDGRVGTVIGLEAGEGTLGGAERADESGLQVPVFYMCGEDDNLVPPDWCAQRFDGTPAKAWMGVALGANHFAPVAKDVGRDDVEFRRYATRWLYARLTDDATAKTAFEGPSFELASDPEWTDVRRK